MDTTEWAQTHAHESILNPCEINWNVFRIILSVIYISQITNLQAFSNYNYPLLLYFPAYRCSQMGSRHNILNWIFQKTLSNVNPAIRLLYFMVMCNFCWNTVHHCLKAKPPSRQWYFESSLTLNLGQVVTSDLMFPVQLFPAGAGSDLLLKNVIWKLNVFPSFFSSQVVPSVFSWVILEKQIPPLSSLNMYDESLNLLCHISLTMKLWDVMKC